MSSVPGYSLEAFVAWQWNITVNSNKLALSRIAVNMSLHVAEILGTIPQRPHLTQEQFAEIVAVYEPFRADIERRLSDFDEETQSWRGYCEYVDADTSTEMEQKVKELIESFHVSRATLQFSALDDAVKLPRNQRIPHLKRGGHKGR